MPNGVPRAVCFPLAFGGAGRSGAVQVDG